MNESFATLVRNTQVRFTVFALFGYLIMTRSFAHLGHSPVYIGEVLLLTFLLTEPSIIFGRWYRWLVKQHPLSPFCWALYVSIAYGLLECVRGLLAGGSSILVITLQNFAFHIYPIFLFIGMWLGRTVPDFLPRFIRWLSWTNGIYGTLFLVLFTNYIEHDYDMERVSFFGQPGGAAVALLGMVCFEKQLMKQWLPLLLNAFVLLGVQIRAEWLGLIAALALWSVLAGRVGQVLKLTAMIFGFLAIGWIADLRIPSPGTHAGEVSARHIVSRLVCAIDPKLGEYFADDAESWGSTVDWRTGWWKAIWQETHTTTTRAIWGPGYGFRIWDYHPEGVPWPIRIPHNVFVYALGYTGWIGVALFVALHVALARALWIAYRRTGSPFGLAYCVLTLIWATFDNFFEAPFGAIPYFLITGLCLAPLDENKDTTEPEAN